MKSYNYVKPNYPFPQAEVMGDKNYKIKPLKPTGITQDEMNAAIIRQFRQLVDHGDIMIDPATVIGHTPSEIAKMSLEEMIDTNPEGFRMIMKHTTGGGAADTQVTSSESMGYGMLMLVFLAGQDEALGFDVKSYFDGMLRSNMYWGSWIPVNGEKSHLMTWQLVAPDGPGTPFYRPSFLVEGDSYKADDEATEGEFDMAKLEELRVRMVKEQYINAGTGVEPIYHVKAAATDGDLDMAFALFLAEEQWGSHENYNYKAQALSILNDIWVRMIDAPSKEYDHEGMGVEPNYHTKTGEWAGPAPHWVQSYGLLWDVTRPSDHMLDHFKAFKVLDPDHDWQRVIDATYECLQQLCELQEVPTGLLPDFAMFDRKSQTWKPVPGTKEMYWENPWDGHYHQNACRTPWRLGTDLLLSGSSPIEEICLKPLNAHLRKASEGEFRNITGYLLDGTSYCDYAPYYANPSLTLAAALGDQEWFDAGWEYASSLEWVDDRYGSYLNVLSMIVASGNYWLPVDI
jgi:hypothetical protein